jgi:hypothetical protein
MLTELNPRNTAARPHPLVAQPRLGSPCAQGMVLLTGNRALQPTLTHCSPPAGTIRTTVEACQGKKLEIPVTYATGRIPRRAESAHEKKIRKLIRVAHKAHESHDDRPRPGAQRRKYEPACKPGSVLPLPGVTAIRLRRPSPDACSSLPESSRGPRSTVLADGLLSYLALLQVGFTLPSALADAVRSYRTISPLPPVRTPGGGIFSVALSVDSRPPGVTWHPALRSPDFPPAGRKRQASDRPADSPVEYRRAAPASQAPRARNPRSTVRSDRPRCAGSRGSR